MKTDRLLADTKTIRYEETDLASLISAPYHFRWYLSDLYAGRSRCLYRCAKYIFNEQTELIFLTGGLLQVLETSGDLQVKMLMFPKEAFLNAMLPIDTPYFNYTHEHPCYHHTADERSQKTMINLWMDMAQMLFTEPMPQFRGQQEHNFLQSLLMWLFNTIPEKLAVSKQYSRTQLLCHRFMQLIREYSMHEHQVAFYAEKLCISSRYLHKITVRHLDGKKPKQLIDEQLVAEIKSAVE